jgi:hypothetical protein
MATNSPVTAQLNLRQMAGEIVSWCPDLDFEQAIRLINNAYRRTLDSRNWYGLLTYGQVVVPQCYTTGQAVVTPLSPIVTGIGTAWNSTMVGLQFRAGFTTPIYTIVAVDTGAQTLTLNLVWGGQNAQTTGYSIFQNICSLGPNIKFCLSMVNQRQGYKLQVRWPRQYVDSFDVWRATTGWTYALVDNYPDANGNPQFELYPAPTSQQSFPYVAYMQPPDLVNEGDCPITWIRSDVLVKAALADALRMGGRSRKYYDPNVAIQFYKEAQFEIQKMQQVDNGLAQRDMKWDFDASVSTLGGVWNQTHAVGIEGW